MLVFPTKGSPSIIKLNLYYIIELLLLVNCFDNVEFVCYCVNVMKNDFSKEETVNFIKQIKSVK